MHFQCFQLIFLIFNKHEQTSWFQTMEFIESIHATLIRALVGPNIHDIFFTIVCSIFDWLCFLFVNIWDDFTPVIVLTLFFILALSSLSRYALHHSIFKIPRISMSLYTMPLFDVMLDCLKRLIIWFALIKTNVVCYISILTLMFYDSAWEAIQVHTPNLLYDYDWFFLFGMLFLKSLNLPRYLWSTN